MHHAHAPRTMGTRIQMVRTKNATNAAASSGAMQYPSTQRAWRKDTRPPRSLACTVTITDPREMITTTPEKSGSDCAGGACVGLGQCSCLGFVVRVESWERRVQAVHQVGGMRFIRLLALPARERTRTLAQHGPKICWCCLWQILSTARRGTAPASARRVQPGEPPPCVVDSCGRSKSGE
jgi:hypothetical protein